MSNNNDITELRSILFDTLRGLKSGSMKPEQAKAINETAGTLIASARVEVEMVELIGGRGSGFIPQTTVVPPKAPGIGLADQAGRLVPHAQKVGAGETAEVAHG